MKREVVYQAASLCLSYPTTPCSARQPDRRGTSRIRAAGGGILRSAPHLVGGDARRRVGEGYVETFDMSKRHALT